MEYRSHLRYKVQLINMFSAALSNSIVGFWQVGKLATVVAGAVQLAIASCQLSASCFEVLVLLLRSSYGYKPTHTRGSWHS